MPTSQTETILQTLRSAESTYYPSEKVTSSLRDKTLVMLVGPVAVGKSYVIDHISATDPDFKQVSVFTTRSARQGETTETVRSQPHTADSLAKILADIKSGALVQYTVHPTTGHVYGTFPSDYHAKYNLLPTLSGAVTSRQKLPFAACYVIGLVTKPGTWRTWLNTRYPEKSEEREKRIKEAIISLEWGLDPTQASIVHWVENSLDYPEKAIEDIINIVKYKQSSDTEARRCATLMLQLAKSEL